MLGGKHFHIGDEAQNTLFLGALSSEDSGQGWGSWHKMSMCLDIVASMVSSIALLIRTQVWT